MTRLTLAVDAMGGDHGPCVTVPATLQALASHPHLHIFLVGYPDIINPLLTQADSAILSRLDIVPAESVIASDVKISQAIRQSHGTSMRMALELVRQGQAHSCISAGNTGALMGLATLLLKPLSGVTRPALMTMLPHQQKGKTVVLDLGANIQADSEMLVQFAVMGAVMSEAVLGIPRPRVALLNIGHEETKGQGSIRDAGSVLKASSDINYIGYLEGNDLLTGKTDVLICDGFSGNVALKTMEGVVRMFMTLLVSSHSKKKKAWWLSMLEQMIKKRLKKQFGHLNPDHYNGACLLGLRETVIKSHGAANQQAFFAAIAQAEEAVRRQVPEKIAARLQAVLPKSD